MNAGPTAHGTPRRRRCRRCRGGVAKAVRAGLLIFFLFPLVAMSVQYVWRAHTVHGLPSALVVQCLDGTAQFLLDAVNDPVRAVLYLALVAAITRIYRWLR